MAWSCSVSFVFISVHIGACEVFHVRCAEALKECGFAVTLQQSLKVKDDMCNEDEFAQTFAHMLLGMSGLRAKRHLQNVKGWPHQFIGCKQTDNKLIGGQMICNEFLKDYSVVTPKQCFFGGSLGVFIYLCCLDGGELAGWLGFGFGS